MKEYYRDLLIFWTVVMVLHGDIVSNLTSKNPMIPYLIVTFIIANFGALIVNLIFNLIKRW